MTFVTLPAPVGGWNARDAYSQMAPDDAVILRNYFPRTTTCELRYGHSQFATGMSGQVETLMAFAGADTNKLFAACSGAATTARIYDITAGGAIGAADVSGLINARWQYVNVSTTGGNYLMAVNGANKARYYEKSAGWGYDGDGTYAITVVDSATCIGINVFKNRVWLMKQDSLLAYYLPTGAIQGAAAALDLRAFAPHGGGLVAMGTWTIDAGAGIDDYAVFITNKGDVIVYRGTDPSSATTWAMTGQWYLGSPVGNRPFIKWGGDLLLICRDGVFSLSRALATSRVNHRAAMSYKIQSAMLDAVNSYGSNFGWQLALFPAQDMMLLNVPIVAGSSQEQYVMNTITGSWAQFQDWEANCWELYGDNLYFGGNTYVGKAWDTNADNGSAIQGMILQAFNYFKEPGKTKRATAMRPTFLTNGSPTIYANINWDYDLSDPTAPLSTTTSTFGTWDSSTWDSGIWGGSLNPSNDVQSVTGSGRAGAPAFLSATLGLQVKYVSTDISLEIGGFL